MKENGFTQSMKASIKADFMAIERIFGVIEQKIGGMKEELKELNKELDS